MQPSGVENAIHELERDGKKIQDAITMLRKILADRAAGTPRVKRRRRLSASARRRISEAAKKRWAALRGGKAESGKRG